MTTIILTILSIVIAIPGLYLAVLAIAGLLRRPAASSASADSLPHFAVVIPAHDEELSIADTIESVDRSAYNPENFRIFVIADNCSDATATIAGRHGAHVAERRDPMHPGKGQALDWFLASHRKRLAAFDAVVIIDADTRMDADFLVEAADALREPSV